MSKSHNIRMANLRAKNKSQKAAEEAKAKAKNKAITAKTTGGIQY